jgi:hypothetical protein
MEIKVLETIKNDEKAGFKTYIFEGYGIVHEFIDYKNLSELRSLVKSRTVQEHTMEMGFPFEWWNECNDDKKEGSFLLMQFIDDQSKEIQFFVIKNCDIFITNKGKTIDTIYVH